MRASLLAVLPLVLACGSPSGSGSSASASAAPSVAAETPHEAIARLNEEARQDAERERLERDGPLEPPPPPPPPTIVTADVFGQALEDNALAAADAYAGRYLLTGKVKGVEVDILERPLVKLSTAGRFRYVQAMLEDGNDDAARKIKAGQDVWLSCVGAKKVVFAQALECTIVEKPSPPAPAAVAAPAKPAGTGTIIDINSL